MVTIAAEEKIQEYWRARRLASPARGKGNVGGRHRDRSIFSPCWIALGSRWFQFEIYASAVGTQGWRI